VHQPNQGHAASKPSSPEPLGIVLLIRFASRLHSTAHSLLLSASLNPEAPSLQSPTMQPCLLLCRFATHPPQTSTSPPVLPCPVPLVLPSLSHSHSLTLPSTSTSTRPPQVVTAPFPGHPAKGTAVAHRSARAPAAVKKTAASMHGRAPADCSRQENPPQKTGPRGNRARAVWALAGPPKFGLPAGIPDRQGASGTLGAAGCEANGGWQGALAGQIAPSTRQQPLPP
jgi:hypothetical protein